MSTKTQIEYINQLKDMLIKGKSKQAYKFMYEWIKTAKLKQASFLEVMEWIESYIKQ